MKVTIPALSSTKEATALPTATPTRRPTRTPIYPPTVELPPSGGKIIFKDDPNGDYCYEIYVLDSNEVRQLTSNDGTFSDGSPVWSPDGSMIAFSSNRVYGMGNIFLMNADGTEQRRLTDFPFGAGQPDWSPDGTRIAFRAAHQGLGGPSQPDIFVMNVDGTGLVNLTNSIGEESHPTWSPDGQKIVFRGLGGISVMNADGTDPQAIVPWDPRYDRSCSSPAWSPNGQWIAFHSYAEGLDWQIYRVDADGSNLTKLTNLNIIGVSSPAWSPDSQKIAFDAGNFIYILDIESRSTTRLVRGQYPDWHK